MCQQLAFFRLPGGANSPTLGAEINLNMPKHVFSLLIILLVASSAIFAQNLHVTYRSKMTFPNQTVANVYGYTAEGHEYALIGASKGLIIADITNPDAPQQIVQIPGPDNEWKEIKTYGHYAYVTSEGGNGLQIVDLSKLPGPNLDYHYYTGNGAIAGAVWRVHALHIDLTKGYLYLYGGRKANGSYLYSGGAVVLDLNVDPYNPTFAGKFDQLGYIHDGYVDNDTLYAGHIYSGLFSVINMSNKTNPELITSQNTPNKATHNTWLSDDRRTLFTTDEVNNSYLAAFDVSDLDNIRLLDKIQSNPGSNSMVHNTHILNNYAVTSWYKDGFTIVDISRPDNLVQVGNYDTYPGGSGGNSEGCWGVYPFFPSGNIIASTITAIGTNNGELWVLSPDYVRACYLEGKITDGLTGAPLNGALIEVLGAGQTANTLPDGVFRTGQEQPGYFTVRVSKTGYQPQEFTALLQRGDVRTLNTSLFPVGNITLNGKVISAADGTAVDGATVTLSNYSGLFSTNSDPAGNFQFVNLPPGIYDLTSAAEGFGHLIKYKQKFTASQSITLAISPKYRLFGPGSSQVLQSQAIGLPNPFVLQTTVRLPREAAGGRLRVSDQTGRLWEATEFAPDQESLILGEHWPAGVYFVRIDPDNGLPQVIKLVKAY